MPTCELYHILYSLSSDIFYFLENFKKYFLQKSAVNQWGKFKEGCQHVCDIVRNSFSAACDVANNKLSNEGVSSPSVKNAVSACFHAIGQFTETTIKESWNAIWNDKLISNDIEQPERDIDIRGDDEPKNDEIE